MKVYMLIMDMVTKQNNQLLKIKPCISNKINQALKNKIFLNSQAVILKLLLEGLDQQLLDKLVTYLPQIFKVSNQLLFPQSNLKFHLNKILLINNKLHSIQQKCRNLLHKFRTFNNNKI